MRLLSRGPKEDTLEVRTVVALAGLGLAAGLVVPARALSYTPYGTFKTKVVYREYECKRTTAQEQSERYECKPKGTPQTFEGEARFPKWIEVTEIGADASTRIRTEEIAAISIPGSGLRRENCLTSKETEIYLRDGTVIQVGYIRVEAILTPPKGQSLAALLISSGPIMGKTERVIDRIEFDHVETVKSKRR